MKKELKVPKEVRQVTLSLKNAGFEAFLVGGCVRDLLIGVEPKDWDITTNATPPEIQAIFPKTFYENDYGTVGVVNEEIGSEIEKGDRLRASMHVVEVTPYRLEEKYSNFRHPDSVIFSKNIEDDLKRRDLTINAIAYDAETALFVDPFGGEKDIHSGIIRAVGHPKDRFNEDALRVLRAVRLAAQLDFAIDTATEKAAGESVSLLSNVSAERIRDEFSKMLMGDNPVKGLVICQKLGIIPYIAPELEEGVGCDQNEAHKYDVWWHHMKSLEHAVNKEWPLLIRLAALFHDVGKPRTRAWSNEKNNWTFYSHDVVGGKMVKVILKRLKYDGETIDKVTKLVRYHLFFSDTEVITLSAVRRMVANVGPDLIWDLMKVRACDRIGTGVPKESPYRLRKYEAMIEEAMRAPISVKMLKMDGARIMELSGEAPGPRIGYILHALLEEVLEDPSKNTVEYMDSRVKELVSLPPEDLIKLGEEGKQKREDLEEEAVGKIREKHHVK